MPLNAIVNLSPLPIVDLHNVTVPADEFLLACPDCCRTNWLRDDRCRNHYSQLASSQPELGLVQCPYGFASLRFRSQSHEFAITGVIPFPRIGGNEEKKASRTYPKHKVDERQIRRAPDGVLAGVERQQAFERDIVRENAAALHELRKLNRTVKQTAELLVETTKGHVDINGSVLRIWKASELMSSQFEIVELLANESLTHQGDCVLSYCLHRTFIR